jgi:hypothetical protein
MTHTKEEARFPTFDVLCASLCTIRIKESNDLLFSKERLM